MKPIYHQLDFKVTCIDTQHIRKDFVASYLIEDNGRAAFIDTGCHLSVPTLLSTLNAKNISRENVDYVLLTHIHLGNNSWQVYSKQRRSYFLHCKTFLKFLSIYYKIL